MICTVTKFDISGLDVMSRPWDDPENRTPSNDFV